MGKVVRVTNPNSQVAISRPGSSATGIRTEVGPQGPPGIGLPGPPGPAGPSGDSARYYQEFQFATPVTEWVIPHNQNSYGLVIDTVDQNGSPYTGDVRHVDANTIKVEWYYPTAGIARVYF